MKSLNSAEIIDKITEKYNISVNELAKRLGYSRAQTIYDIQKGKTKNISDKMADKFMGAFPELNRVWLLTGTGEMLNSSPKKKIRPNFGISEPKTIEEIKEELENLPSGGLRIKEYPTKLAVRLVTNKAQAGWSEGYYADEYLEDMPIVMIDADQEYKGKYLAFEVVGDSMEPDYLEGDIVICREVQRHLWSYKLHYNDWDFVIAHATQGIMLKEITAHNVEKGIITCHSINPAHKDFKVNLREVTYLYNVVEIRQKGSRKRWNRAKDFYTEE